MTNKPIIMEDLGESWVELGPRGGTPLPFAGEEYLRLLREAQRESYNNSARQSLASSGRASPCCTPKSPPNSPNTEPSTEDEFRALDLNYPMNKEGELSSAEWVWQWSSRPDQLPPKDWKFRHPARRAALSLRRARVGGRPLFGRDLLASLLLSNLISLLLGAGIGVWLSRRSTILSRVSLQ